jgi:hypothetical protein
MKSKAVNVTSWQRVSQFGGLALCASGPISEGPEKRHEIVLLCVTETEIATIRVDVSGDL